RGTAVELVAFASLDDGALSFEQASVRSAAQAAAAPQAGPSPATLTTAAQVRGLGPDEASRRHPVRPRAPVTHNHPHMRLPFVPAATAGIYVEAFRHIHRVAPGDVVEVEGRSAPGAFAPIVDHPRVSVVGHGPLPAARRVPPEQLESGGEDSQWIEVEGVVRAVAYRRRSAILRVAAGGIRFPVELPGPAEPGLGAPRVNARVRLRAVCRSLLTLKGQLAGVALHCPGLDAVQILTPPPAEPFALPMRPIRSLLQFAP